VSGRAVLRLHDPRQPHYTACGARAHMAEFAPGMVGVRAWLKSGRPGEPSDGDLECSAPLFDTIKGYPRGPGSLPIRR